MKKIIIPFIITLLIGFQAFANSDKEVKIKTSAICGMCKTRIERNVGLSKGVKEVNLDGKTKVVTVVYNEKKTNEAAIRTVISKTGYDADKVPAVQAAHDKLPSCCQKTAAKH
jgi:mercuric ion binding protein